MKIFLSLFFIIVFIFYFGTAQVFAQKKSKPKEIVVLEISFPKENDTQKVEIPINRNRWTGHGIGGGGGQGCGDCDESKLFKYKFSAYAWRIGREKSKLEFEILVRRHCKTRGTFILSRNQQTKLELKCGVSLVAYYGFENKGAN